eukprot:1556-Eustigmatos_ZCMA.PRE.1
MRDSLLFTTKCAVTGLDGGLAVLGLRHQQHGCDLVSVQNECYPGCRHGQCMPRQWILGRFGCT